MKDGGLKEVYSIKRVERKGIDPESMMRETVQKIKEILESKDAPKCIFVVYNYKHQIMQLVSEIRKLQCGDRELMPFVETEDPEYA